MLQDIWLQSAEGRFKLPWKAYEEKQNVGCGRNCGRKERVVELVCGRTVREGDNHRGMKSHRTPEGREVVEPWTWHGNIAAGRE